jgi:hypothetical protein
VFINAKESFLTYKRNLLNNNIDEMLLFLTVEDDIVVNLYNNISLTITKEMFSKDVMDTYDKAYKEIMSRL